ncbi:MAG: tRNA uridine-5-carboxymethylaminomethyl(34) synthesis GTPase MnmE [Treponema sp.]|jgi:tRNA modification GTPase|nr:tRNA uridine-5-carboxymethylaminomethyl(34) synthesis GTPase MnmE [Treponema sp.]
MIGENAKASYGDESPIAAFATTPANSALTLIRCSGKGAIEIVASVFTPDKIKDAPGNTVVHGWIVDKEKREKSKENREESKEQGLDNKIDEVLISVFRAPKSYTGEDSMDICCHGGLSAGRAVMAVLKSAGFRSALAGEFTFRAFVNGKLDLTRSESVMELVSAKTDASRHKAVMRLSGSLEKEINEIKKTLVEILAGAEIYLDYSEDEISADSDEAEGRLPNQDTALLVLSRLKKLALSWQIERIYQEGVTVVIAGRPNAGKSSLFNALLKEDRSIVTEVPGTTRDWISALVSVEGIPVRLIDTAGLRDTSDSVEKIGVDRSRKLLDSAELVLYLIDGAQGLTDEDSEFIGKFENCLSVWNKADIAIAPSSQKFVSVSAKTGEGLSQLYVAIGSAIQKQSSLSAAFQDAATQEPLAAVGTERQKKLIDAACNAMEEALMLAEKEEPLDLIAPLLREAVNSLGEITGEVSTADILEEMFSKFCVGK